MGMDLFPSNGKELSDMAIGLDVIGIVVEDMARSLTFYRRLGLELPPELDGERHAEFTLPSGMRLAWDRQDTLMEVVPGFTPPAPGAGRIALAFQADDPAEVDAIYDKLMSDGYTGRHAPWDAVWGQRYAVVEDPDGNEIDLFAPRP
jgi:catechol 2,3-dioxygenase-like lactoylglutathione lyase family enzyme